MKFLTCLRPLPLARENSAFGLRQFACALWDAALGLDGCPRNLIGPLQGRAGLGTPMRKYRQATKDEV